MPNHFEQEAERLPYCLVIIDYGYSAQVWRSPRAGAGIPISYSRSLPQVLAAGIDPDQGSSESPITIPESASDARCLHVSR
jgi:hypothetical protein